MIVNGEGSPTARIMIVGEAPGAEEERTGHPFSGPSGQELNRILNDAGLDRSQCFVTNVCRVRPYNNDISQFIAMAKKDITPAHRMLRDRYVKQPVFDGLEMLQREIRLVKPHVIVPVGNLALWALTGRWGIMKWRGSMLHSDLLPEDNPKVIPTYHPALILRQWSMRHFAVHDFRRAAREQYSLTYDVPDWKFIVHPRFMLVESTLRQLIDRCEDEPTKLSFDLETKRGHIDCAGIAWSRTEAICIPFMSASNPAGYWNEDEEAHIVHWLLQLLTHPNARVIGQNLLYDCQYVYRHWHFIPRVSQDTMISHHVAFPGLRKSLDLQASLYANWYVQWKPDKISWKEGG